MENKLLDEIINSQKENENEDISINNQQLKNSPFFNNFDINDESLGTVNVKVFGVGGAGCNVIKHIVSNGKSMPKNIAFFAINTDAKALKRMNNQTNQIILGRKLLNGMGAGANPNVGKSAALESEEDIRKILTSTPTDILFIIAGMGKGTGSGASPEIARIANELNIMTVGIINFPSLKAEGSVILQNAHEHFQQLSHYLTSYTLISNDKIIDNVDHQIGYCGAFERANEQITNIINSILELINSGSEQNIDFSDIKNFFNKARIFQWGCFVYPNQTNKQELFDIINENINSNIFDVCLSEHNTTMLVMAKINKQTLTTFKNDIKDAFTELTNDSHLSIIYDVSYHNESDISINYLISSSESNVNKSFLANQKTRQVNIDDILFNSMNNIKKFTTQNNTTLTRNSTKIVSSNKIQNEDIELDEVSSVLASAQIKKTKALN